MATYEMTCACGDKMQSEGDTKEGAVDALLTTVLTPEAMVAHMDAKHGGAPAPSPEEARAMMLQTAQPV